MVTFAPTTSVGEHFQNTVKLEKFGVRNIWNKLIVKNRLPFLKKNGRFVNLHERDNILFIAEEKYFFFNSIWYSFKFENLHLFLSINSRYYRVVLIDSKNRTFVTNVDTVTWSATAYRILLKNIMQ